MKKKLATRAIAVSAVVSLLLASGGIATAETQANTGYELSGSVKAVNLENLTVEEQKAVSELTPVVKQVFEGALSQDSSGKYVFDYEKAEYRLGEDVASDIQKEVVRLENVERSARSGIQSRSYASCVLEKSGYGSLVGLFTGAYSELIKKKLWQEVAKVIVRTVGLSAVRGGVVGLAASLSVSAGWCAFLED